MPACGSCANPGAAPTSGPGAASTDGVAVGELWFQRPDANAPNPALLLKLLFTKEPLSIQVHPDDAFARSIGLANGKTEAWYILSATPEAQVAVGLKRQLTPPQLRASIEDGSIADLIQWRPVRKDDVIFVPAGTIHAIGAGIVLAEIQQSSDTTFRLFDHGRQREIHVDNAVAAANAGPPNASPPRRLSEPDAPRREPAFRAGANRPAGEFELGAACGAGDLVLCPRRPARNRVGRVRRRSDLRRRRPHEPQGRSQWSEGSAGVSGSRARSIPCCRGSGEQPASLPASRCTSVPKFARAWPRRDHDPAAPPRLHRQFAAAPLRDRHLHDRSAAGDRDFTPGPGNLHRGDDRPRSRLRLSRVRSRCRSTTTRSKTMCVRPTS